MASVQQHINLLINDHPAIKRLLEQDIINLRGLSRYLIRIHHLEISEDAVVSAIRRYIKDPAHMASQPTSLVGSTVRTRDNLASFLIASPPDKTRPNMLVPYKMISGEEYTRVIINRADEGTVTAAFSGKITKLHPFLTEFIITAPLETIKGRGACSKITSELFLHNIRVEEIIINPPEFIVYIASEHAVAALKVLQALTQPEDASSTKPVT